MSQCDECHRETDKLYAFGEWRLCEDCLEKAKENERINAEETHKEEMRLLKRRK